MSKLVLNDLSNLQNETTAVNTINTNNAATETAMENTLSRDGTSPNAMHASIDFNGYQLLNVPTPTLTTDVVRLQELNNLTVPSGNMPAGGTTGQFLKKNSNANYDAAWATGSGVTSVGLSMPADFNVASSPITTSGTIAVTLANTATGTGGLVRASSPTLITPTLGAATATTVNKVTITQPATAATLTIANNKTASFNNTMTFASGSDSNVYTFPSTTCIVASADSSQTLTNKTMDTNANTINLSGAQMTRGQFPGVTTNTPASAGNIGEFSIANLAIGSAISLTTSTAANVTSFTLGAGEWDLTGFIAFVPAAGTSVTQYIASISTTTGTLDVTTPFAFNQQSFAAQIPGGLPTCISCGAVSAILAGNTTYFLVARSIFTVSTMTAYGSIRARRIH